MKRAYRIIGINKTKNELELLDLETKQVIKYKPILKMAVVCMFDLDEVIEL